MKFYVYLLCYPDGTPFYVGKGSGNRINDHEQDARRGRIGAKYDAIRAIWQSGGQVVKRIIFETSDEQQALDHEQHLIAHYGIANLTNYQPGGRPRAPKHTVFVMTLSSVSSAMASRSAIWRPSPILTTFISPDRYAIVEYFEQQPPIALLGPSHMLLASTMTRRSHCSSRISMGNQIDKMPRVAYSVLERLLMTENGVKRLNPNIARMLADLDLTISAFARRAGVARSTIFALLNPDQHPDRVGGMHPVTASKLSRAYAEAAGITPDQAYALIIVEEN